MTGKNRKLGIMGGTFDPVHYGHLVTAEAARLEFDLDQVLFLPSGVPPHKTDKQVPSAEHRYMMPLLAPLSNPHFEVSCIEIDREGVRYTIYCLQILREQCGPDCELFFITGADAMFEIIEWRGSDRLLRIAHFIAASRPGYSLSELPPATRRWVDEHRNRFHLLNVPAMAISSTDIRNRVRMGRSIRYLVPEQVEHYIRRHRLYQ